MLKTIFSAIFGSRDPEEQKKIKFLEFEKSFHGNQEMINNSKAQWLTSRGNHKGIKGHLGEAISDFEEAISLKNDYLPAYLGLALAYKQKGNLDKAEKTLNDAPDKMYFDGKIIGTKQEMLKMVK